MTDVVRGALASTGIELVASCQIGAYDQRAPDALRSGSLLPGARGVIVAGSAGAVLWRRFRDRMNAHRARWLEPNPYDAFIGEQLSRADLALAAAGIRFRRLDAAFASSPRVDFVALAMLVGLGSPGPFSLLIHPAHGPWWALRGAWLVDAEVEGFVVDVCRPCDGCAAPCVGGWPLPGAPRPKATAEVRGRCVIGQASRYDDDQIAYHYDRVHAIVRFSEEV